MLFRSVSQSRYRVQFCLVALDSCSFCRSFLVRFCQLLCLCRFRFLLVLFVTRMGVICVLLSICCQLCAALYQSLLLQLLLSYAFGTKPPLLLSPSALLLAKPMLAPLIVPALPPGVLAPPFANAKVGLGPAFFMSSTARWYAVFDMCSCHSRFASASALL